MPQNDRGDFTLQTSRGTLLESVLGDPEPQPTVSEHVAARLRELILTGRLPPGTRLRLSHVANRLGVSVMPVREAMRILEAERLVISEPRRGAVVAGLSFEDIEELFAVRGALESLAAEHGAERIDTDGVRAMRTEFDAMGEACDSGDKTGFLAHDRRFHSILYESAGRPALLARIDELLESARRAGDPYIYRDWYPLPEVVEAHRPILEAVERHDHRLVAQLVRENISRASEQALRAFEEDRQRVLSGGPDAEDWTTPDAKPQS